LTRCAWAGSDPLYIRYHDGEWGVPVHDDRRFFEMLVLEGAQAGLSWITILRKRAAYRKAFDRFDPKKVAGYDARKRRALVADAGIVRNRAKVAATIANARAVLDLDRPLSELLWAFAPTAPRPAPASVADVPAVTPESTAMAKALRANGFRFVGPTTAYALMQATGMVDDHLARCEFRRS
jgi:DNA-3-methyladenine glycosylase I